MRWTKKEISKTLILTPLFHELNPQEKKDVINYIHTKYGNLRVRPQKRRGRR